MTLRGACSTWARQVGPWAELAPSTVTATKETALTKSANQGVEDPLNLGYRAEDLVGLPACERKRWVPGEVTPTGRL